MKWNALNWFYLSLIASLFIFMNGAIGQSKVHSLQNSLESRTQGIHSVDDHQIIVSTYGIFPWTDSINLKVIVNNQIKQSINVGTALGKGYTYRSWEFKNDHLLITAIDRSCCDCGNDPFELRYIWQGDSLLFDSIRPLHSGYKSFEVDDSIHLVITSHFLTGYLKNIKTDEIVKRIWIEGFRQDSFIIVDPFVVQDTIYFVLKGLYSHEPFKIIRCPDYKRSVLEWDGLWSQNELLLHEASFPYFYEDVIVIEKESGFLFYNLDLTLKIYYPLKIPRLTKSAFQIFRWGDDFNTQSIGAHFIHEDGWDIVGYLDSTTFQVISLDKKGWTTSKYEGKVEGPHLPVSCFRNSDGLQIISSKLDHTRPPNIWSQSQVGTFDIIWSLKDSIPLKHDIGVTSVKLLDEVYALGACRYHWNDSSFQKLTAPNIEVTIKNYGRDTIFRFTLNYFKNIGPGCGPICNYFDGKSKNYQSTLIPGDSMKVLLNHVIFNTHPITDSVNYCFWSSSPNNELDNNLKNDEGCLLAPINIDDLNENQLSIYPNPNSGEFVIHVDRYISETPEFKITNLHGQGIKDFEVHSSSYYNNEYKILGLTSGIYHIEVIYTEASLSTLLIVH